MPKKFIIWIWEDNKVFLRNVIGHAVKLILTIVILKIIYLISNLAFRSNKPLIIEYMEGLSAFGLLAIFFILVLFEIYNTIISNFEKK